MEEGKVVASDYQWHYDPTPLHKLQELVDGLDWISETYIFGGYARALLGYPPFPEREKFGPGHDIDFVTSPKYPEALEMMRKEGIQPWEGFTKHMSLEKAWEWHEKEIKKGFLPIPIMKYMLEKQEKIDSYYLSWGWEKHMIDFETDMPIIRIKPKPLIVYQKSRLEKRAAGSNPGGLHGLWECVAGFGGLEDGISEQNVDVAIRNIKSIDRGTEIMVQDKLILPPERLRILDKLKHISTLVETKQWEETIKPVWGPSGLEAELHSLLEKICGDDSPSKMSSSNPDKAEPLIPYWAIPAAFTLILVGAAFAGWVATQLEGEA